MTEFNPTSAKVVLLASDLILGSSVSGHVTAAGGQYRSALTVAEAISHIAEDAHCLLLVDLGTPGLDVADLANRIPAPILARAVAYGPHVHVAKLEAATSAGFGKVMSRGQFSAQVAGLIAEFSAAQNADL